MNNSLIEVGPTADVGIKTETEVERKAQEITGAGLEIPLPSIGVLPACLSLPARKRL